MSMNARHARRRVPKAIMPKRTDKVGRPYCVITISVYEDALADLDALVQVIRERGVSRASRSAIIRAAITHLRMFDPVVADALVRALPEFRGES